MYCLSNWNRMPVCQKQGSCHSGSLLQCLEGVVGSPGCWITCGRCKSLQESRGVGAESESRTIWPEVRQIGRVKSHGPQWGVWSYLSTWCSLRWFISVGLHISRLSAEVTSWWHFSWGLCAPESSECFFSRCHILFSSPLPAAWRSFFTCRFPQAGQNRMTRAKVLGFVACTIGSIPEACH